MAAASPPATKNAATVQRQCLLGEIIAPTAIMNRQVSATVVNTVELRAACGRWREFAAITDGAVVVKVSIAVAIPPAAMLIDDVELHLASEGKSRPTNRILLTGPILLSLAALRR
jgi:hypothetical protein